MALFHKKPSLDSLNKTNIFLVIFWHFFGVFQHSTGSKAHMLNSISLFPIHSDWFSIVSTLSRWKHDFVCVVIFCNMRIWFQIGSWVGKCWGSVLNKRCHFFPALDMSFEKKVSCTTSPKEGFDSSALQLPKGIHTLGSSILFRIW